MSDLLDPGNPHLPDAALAESTDEQLLARVAAGDADAFAAMMKRHEVSLWRFARAHAASLQDTEDIMQEASLAAWRHAPSFALRGSVRGWLITITRNTIAHYYRKRVDEPRDIVSLDSIALEAGWGAVDAVTEINADRELVTAALARLTSGDREILLLRDVEGFTGEETAELLKLSLAAMKSRLHRARLSLVAAVRELDAHEPT